MRMSRENLKIILLSHKHAWLLMHLLSVKAFIWLLLTFGRIGIFQ